MKHEGTFCFYLDYDGVTRRFGEDPRNELGLPNAEFSFYFGRLCAALLQLGYSRILIVSISDHAWSSPVEAHKQFMRPIQRDVARAATALSDEASQLAEGGALVWKLISDLPGADRYARCSSVLSSWESPDWGSKTRGVIIDDTSTHFTRFVAGPESPPRLVFFPWNARLETAFFSSNMDRMINRSLLELGFSAFELENIEQFLFNGKQFD